MKLMLFLEIEEGATYRGTPIVDCSQEFGQALSAWIGENLEVTPKNIVAQEFNMVCAANATMKDALHNILEGGIGRTEMVEIARRALVRVT